MAGKWDNLKPEEKESLEFSEKVTRQPKEKEVSLVRTGPKRHEYGKTNLPPFEGLNEENSEKIRIAVGAIFSGYSQKKACELSGIPPNNYVNFQRSHLQAFEAAEKEIVERSYTRYHQNLWIIRTALTEAGPRAVRTIIDLMDNPKIAPGVRVKAAMGLLKMANVTGEAASGSEELKFELAETIRDARKEVKSESILEAEDAEVIEDGDDRDFDTNELD